MDKDVAPADTKVGRGAVISGKSSTSWSRGATKLPKKNEAPRGTSHRETSLGSRLHCRSSSSTSSWKSSLTKQIGFVCIAPDRILLEDSNAHGPQSIPSKTHDKREQLSETLHLPGAIWLKRTDRGRIFLSQKETAALVLEGTSASFCIATYEGTPQEKEKQASGQFLVESTLMVSPAGNLDGQAVYILIDILHAAAVTGACDFCALHLNCSTKDYKVESYKQGGYVRLLQTVTGLSALQPRQPISVKAVVRGDALSVAINGKTVTEDLFIGRSPAVPFSSACTRAVGVAVYGKTRAVVSKFGIASETPCPLRGDLSRTCPPGENWLTETSFDTNQAQRSRFDSLSHFDEEKALFSLIERDVVRSSLNVHFDDVAALEAAKKLLKEAVVLPCLFPDLFTGIRQPWRGILLFGPPGTGKTLLAKAVASTAQCTFFNCSVATLTSKWRGESEKLVRALFQVDSLMSRRASADEHEASRRFKSELLTQLDGLFSSTKTKEANTGDLHAMPTQESVEANAETKKQPTEPHVMVLAATNCPWDLDEAFRRRLEKRIYTPLPDMQARSEMIRIFLRDTETSGDLDILEVVRRTEGYSGADLYLLCREACMTPMRRLIAALDVEEIRCKRANGELRKEKTRVGMDDFLAALHASNPANSLAEIRRFEEWNKQYGSY